MSKRVKEVKKTIRQGVLDVVYLTPENTPKYASVPIEAYTTNREALAKMASRALGVDAVKLLSITETIVTYTMPIDQYLKHARCIDGVEGGTIVLDEGA